MKVLVQEAGHDPRKSSVVIWVTEIVLTSKEHTCRPCGVLHGTAAETCHTNRFVCTMWCFVIKFFYLFKLFL